MFDDPLELHTWRLTYAVLIRYMLDVALCWNKGFLYFQDGAIVQNREAKDPTITHAADFPQFRYEIGEVVSRWQDMYAFAADHCDINDPQAFLDGCVRLLAFEGVP